MFLSQEKALTPMAVQYTGQTKIAHLLVGILVT